MRSVPVPASAARRHRSLRLASGPQECQARVGAGEGTAGAADAGTAGAPETGATGTACAGGAGSRGATGIRGAATGGGKQRSAMSTYLLGASCLWSNLNDASTE